MRRQVLLALAGLLALASAPTARAQDEVESAGQLAAVQARRYFLNHEIDFSVSFLPLDAFYKGVAVEAAYTYHFSDTLGWEVIRGFYSFNLQTQLRKELEEKYGVQPTAFEQINYALTSDLCYAPAYGKFALFNRSVVNSELFVLIGGTLGKLTNSFKAGPTVGGGFRFFVSDLVSVRFDLHYSVLIARQLTHLVTISLGFGLDFGGREQKARAALGGKS